MEYGIWNTLVTHIFHLRPTVYILFATVTHGEWKAANDPTRFNPTDDFLLIVRARRAKIIEFAVGGDIITLALPPSSISLISLISLICYVEDLIRSRFVRCNNNRELNAE